jgi:hypothetical protein
MDDEREAERPRPRVVDKRVSAGGKATPKPSSEPPPEDAAQSPSPSGAPPTSLEPEAPPASAGPPPGDGAGQVWTPEQEAEARRMAQEIAETPSIEWVVNTAVSLANIAATKLDFGAPRDAELAIDALAGILKEVGGRMEDAEAPLRQTLAQLQMAYASRIAPPPGAAP